MKIKDLDSKDFKKDELVMILLRFFYNKKAFKRLQK